MMIHCVNITISANSSYQSSRAISYLFSHIYEHFTGITPRQVDKELSNKHYNVQGKILSTDLHQTFINTSPVFITRIVFHRINIFSPKKYFLIISITFEKYISQLRIF